MSACAEVGCGGAIAADGYCDTCGTKPAIILDAGEAVSAAPPSSTVGGAAASAPRPGAPCHTGCGGVIAADGYCDTCGMAAASSPAVGRSPSGSMAQSARAGARPSVAVASAATLGGRMTTSSRRSSRSRRTGTSRQGIGLGLIDVAPTAVGDPSAAIMSDAEIEAVLGEVPEEERHCSSCGRPVGRSDGDRAGRRKGFCGSCRAAFDFVTNEPSLQAGERVAGQYEILGPLAHGGMGWIYLGQDKAVSDRWVVLKGLLNEDDPDAALAAVAERQFLAQIEHPNIVNIYNFVTHRGAGYIVMEMVGGASLNAKLKQRRRANRGVPDPLPPAEAIAYVLGVLPAFGYLHDRGLVYNDLKPANIMAVGDDVKLIDVGAVMRADDPSAAIFGTQGFQAPEVARDGPSPSSDLYTVGRTLAVLTMRFVFHTGPYLHALPPPSEEPLFDRWESLHRFLLRACAAHPDHRFQSAGEMTDQLTGVLREIVAVSEGVPRLHSSELFDTDQLTNLLVSGVADFDPARADERVLPRPKVDPEDPAAAFLGDLPELSPARTLDLIEAARADGQLDDTVELRFRRIRELIDGGDDPADALATSESIDPWDWRHDWYRGVAALDDDPAQAAEFFSRVWTELPGELAPRLAIALAAERAGFMERAAALYERTIAVDRSFVSAAFGLARCRAALGDRSGVVGAFGLVPASSAAHYDAQVASARALLDGQDAAPTLVELRAASDTISRLQLDAIERAALSARVYERALDGLLAGDLVAPAGARLIDADLDERSIRGGLEQVYRTQARLTDDAAERIRLVDRANAVRPRTWI